MWSIQLKTAVWLVSSHMNLSRLAGTLKSILVKENQVVKKGQAIALIDPAQLRIKKNQIIGNIQPAKQQLGQLDAQIKALKGQIAAEGESHRGSIASAEAELTQKQRDYRERKLTSTKDVEEVEASVRLAFIGIAKISRRLKVSRGSQEVKDEDTIHRVAQAIIEKNREFTRIIRGYKRRVATRPPKPRDFSTTSTEYPA